MDIITYSKLKKCISVDINSGHSFATTTDRDTFFTTNPTQLKANMYIYCNGQLQQYINSAWEVRSTAIQGSKGDKGDTGISPHIDLTTNNWFIDTVDTGVKAIGTNGNDGVTPHIDETTNNWFIGTTNTGIKAVGLDGISPHIGVNGNWYIGETDTLVKAIAVDGTSPHIGENGNWFIGETDTLVKAEAIDGVGVQSVVDNGNNTFTITLTNGTPTIIDKIDTISSDIVTQGETNLYVNPTEKNKLTNIEENAEVNNISDTNATDLTDSGDTMLHYHSSDRDRTNHTGTQAINTITGLQTVLDNKTNKDFTLYTQKTTVDNDDKIAINDSIDSNAVKYVTLNQLVSSVQDPHNKGYYATGTALNTAIPTATNGDFAVVGETNTIWVWNGTAFVDSSASGAVLSVNGRTGVITLTKTDVGLNNVVNLDTSTTANITDSTDKRFVTDANLVVLGNTSGTNTGDETNSTIKTKLGTDLSNKVDKVEGKSLIADTEITRLSTVINYDDSSVQSHISNTDIHVTTTNKSTWDSKANGIHTHVKSDITDFPTIPTVTNDLTNELKSNYDNAYTNIHTHTNKTQIDKIGEDTNGNLTYNGNSISANSSWNNISNKPFNTLDSNTLSVTDGVLSVIGGSGGTTNYTDLNNKPTINDVELSGNKTSSDLGLANIDHNHTVADITDLPTIPTVTNDLTNGLKSNYDTAYNHSLSAHAPTNAEANVQSDWSQTDTVADDYIKNKPTIPEAYTLPTATETTLGGIKAKAKTTETVECAIDTATGKLYVPESGGGGLTEKDIFPICADGVTNLGNKTNTTSWYMSKAYILDSVTTMGNYWFYSAPIVKISGGGGLTKIGNYFANSCMALTTISLPALTTVGYSFAGSCEALTTISLPVLTTVGYYFAYTCPLTHLVVGGANTLTLTSTSNNTYTTWKLPVEDMVAFGTALKTATSTTALTFGATYWNALSAAQKAIFTDKNYTVTTA